MRVLIIKLSAFGDIIHSLPVVEYFQEFSKKNNTKVELHWLIEERWSPIIDKNPGVNRVLLTNTSQWRRAVLHRSTWQEIFQCVSGLRHDRYDLVIDINGLLRSAMFARLTRSYLRVGFSKDSDICKEKHGVLLLDKTHSVPHIHVVDQTIKLLEMALPADIRKPLNPSLPVNHGAEKMAGRVVQEKSLIPKRFAVIAAGGGWETKLLDEKIMSELCDHIARYSLIPVLSWSGDYEKERARRISALSMNSVKQLGNLPVDVFLEVMRMARVVIGPDTGTIHAASAVKTPTVSYYGPSSALYSGPRRVTDRVVQLSPPCGPCFKRQCSENHCHHLDVKMIINEIDNLLEA